MASYNENEHPPLCGAQPKYHDNKSYAEYRRKKLEEKAEAKREAQIEIGDAEKQQLELLSSAQRESGECSGGSASFRRSGEGGKSKAVEALGTSGKEIDAMSTEALDEITEDEDGNGWRSYEFGDDEEDTYDPSTFGSDDEDEEDIGYGGIDLSALLALEEDGADEAAEELMESITLAEQLPLTSPVPPPAVSPPRSPRPANSVLSPGPSRSSFVFGPPSLPPSYPPPAVGVTKSFVNVKSIEWILYVHPTLGKYRAKPPTNLRYCWTLVYED